MDAGGCSAESRAGSERAHRVGNRRGTPALFRRGHLLFRREAETQAGAGGVTDKSSHYNIYGTWSIRDFRFGGHPDWGCHWTRVHRVLDLDADRCHPKSTLERNREDRLGVGRPVFELAWGLDLFLRR